VRLDMAGGFGGASTMPPRDDEAAVLWPNVERGDAVAPFL
jgi:hypothetical protein